MTIKICIATDDIGSAAIDQKGIGQVARIGSIGIWTDRDNKIVIVQAGVEILNPKRQFVSQHHLGAAACLPAPTIGLAIVAERIEAVRRVKAVIETRIGAAAGDIEQRPAARRVTGAQTRSGFIFDLAG